MTVHKSTSWNKKKITDICSLPGRLVLKQKEVYFTEPQAPEGLRCTLLVFSLQRNFSLRSYMGTASQVSRLL